MSKDIIKKIKGAVANIATTASQVIKSDGKSVQDFFDNGGTVANKNLSFVGHKHSKSEISDFPTSMPANGGNAATVGGAGLNSLFPYTDYGTTQVGANDLTLNGVYRSTNWVNRPPYWNDNQGTIMQIAYNGNWKHQIGFSPHSPKMWSRHSPNGTWSAWRQIDNVHNSAEITTGNNGGLYLLRAIPYGDVRHGLVSIRFTAQSYECYETYMVSIYGYDIAYINKIQGNYYNGASGNIQLVYEKLDSSGIYSLAVYNRSGKTVEIRSTFNDLLCLS